VGTAACSQPTARGQAGPSSSGMPGWDDAGTGQTPGQTEGMPSCGLRRGSR